MIEEKTDVGSDDWEGCDRFGLLSLYMKVSELENGSCWNKKQGRDISYWRSIICL
jgi:hypothetical protein